MSIFYKSMVWSQFEYQSWQWQLPGDILRECHANQLSAQKWDHDILYKKRKKKKENWVSKSWCWLFITFCSYITVKYNLWHCSSLYHYLIYIYTHSANIHVESIHLCMELNHICIIFSGRLLWQNSHSSAQ